MVRIVNNGISTHLNSPAHSKPELGARDIPSVGQQVQTTLFGRAKPPVFDAAKFPELASVLSMLNRYRRKLAAFAGDHEDDYNIVLADGTIAMIGEDGTIYMGAGFLAAFANKPEVLVGALAHEIGHRPKQWGTKRFAVKREMTHNEMHDLCKHEETRADIFAGTALAELGMSCEPLVEFLLKLEKGPHPDYFPAKVRGEVIREAHESRAYRASQQNKLFPRHRRMTSSKGHIGDF